MFAKLRGQRSLISYKTKQGEMVSEVSFGLCIGPEVSMAKILVVTFWVMILCSLVGDYRRFDTIYCHHLKGTSEHNRSYSVNVPIIDRDSVSVISQGCIL
jgi:hypothetical protein